MVFNSDFTTLEKVNTLGLLTTIQGSDKSLKPLLLLSHYDVTPAPVETYDRWSVSKQETREGGNRTKPVNQAYLRALPFLSFAFLLFQHGPFSGFNDGEYIYGRGASDDKTLLVSLPSFPPSKRVADFSAHSGRSIRSSHLPPCRPQLRPSANDHPFPWIRRGGSLRFVHSHQASTFERSRTDTNAPFLRFFQLVKVLESSPSSSRLDTERIRCF